jgi:hypothetical protein
VSPNNAINTDVKHRLWRALGQEHINSSPFQSECVSTQLEGLVSALCKRPGMYVSEADLGQVCAFIQGFDTAQAGGPLRGLHQWLVLKINEGNNVHWVGNLQWLVRQKVGDSVSQETSISAAGDILGEFFIYRRENGLTKIFNDYAKWLLRRKSCQGPLRKGPTSRSTRSRENARSGLTAALGGDAVTKRRMPSPER